MHKFKIDLQCECGIETKGFESVVVDGAKAPITCPNCSRLFSIESTKVRGHIRMKFSKKLGAEENLWLTVLARGAELKNKTSAQIRKALEEGNFPKNLIDAFIAGKEAGKKAGKRLKALYSEQI